MIRAFLLAGVAIVCVAGGAALYAIHEFNAPGPLARTQDIVVPHGGLSATADSLAASGVIDSPFAFRVAVAATFAEGPIHAAELEFPAGASLRTVLAVLRFSRPIQHKLSIPEGLTAAQIAQLLAHADALAGDVPVPAEGRILPDTYIYERATSRGGLVERGEAAMHKLLLASWAQRAPGLPLRTPQDALVLASVVEREAKLPAERPMIARVFLNRIEKGMRLQADPTAAYGASGGLGHLDRKLEHDDLGRNDAYNTYVIEGLPAGPICNPGIAAIRAVLHPADGNALYFVSDGSGGHLFTDHLAVQNANVEHLRGLRK